MKNRDFVYSPVWNLLLITTGAFIWVSGIKGAVIPHHFITGGIFGVSLLAFYSSDWLSPNIWFFFLNLPLIILGWFWVSHRFVLYSLYGMVITTVLYELIHVDFHIVSQLYAAIAGGIICGAGGGLILRSLGSAGGLDILGILLNQKYNFGIGRFFLLFNTILFIFSLFRMEIDRVIVSILMVFITSQAVEYVLSLFSQRKLVMIISKRQKEIAGEILDKLKRGATLLKAEGAYSGKPRDILMTITNNVQLKRLEEMVFTIDPNAFFIVENTFNVLGTGFGRRKIY